MSLDLNRPRILVCDDNGDVLVALRLLLKNEGFIVSALSSPEQAIALLKSDDFDAALIDMNFTRDTTSGEEGLDLLTKMGELDETLPVIVMTAWGSVDGAVEAMRRGARDYVQKPWDNTRLVATLRTQVELCRALREKDRLERAQARQSANALPEMIATSRTMEPVLHLIDRVGPSDAHILVTGEHGTGKEVVARTIHAVSSRKDRTFVPVNMGGLAESLFESELFGHLRGAFTDAKEDRAGCFELANGGTLFLDEIGTLTLSKQVVLLRVLQTGEYHPLGSSKVRKSDVRIISATNVNLQEAVARGEFREDLLYRLNTVEIHLPPLRDRRGDIVPLALHFLNNKSRAYNKKRINLTQESITALQEHSWPGNVRELEHCIERAILLAGGDEIRPTDLMLGQRRKTENDLEAMTLDEAEKILVEKALARHDRNVSEAARALGLSRSALYRRMQHHGIK